MAMPELQGANIHITGIVQGVGFRPFIYGLAVRYALTGWVRNSSAGVDIEVDGTQSSLDSFADSIRSDLPPLARIDTFVIKFGSPKGFANFEIVRSEAVAGEFQPIAPDAAICSECLTELFDPADRRYLYPFINCTNCGPRFTIITDIPYDRPNTTMAHFEMCPDCGSEYVDPLDRRFHAQPIACPVCGPQVWLESSDGQKIVERNEAILLTKKLLAEGKIVAIKGLGGFHLACDATNEKAVDELRRRKLRVDKPFAIMMNDAASVERYCSMDSAERDLLESWARPIVLLTRKADAGIANAVAPKQNSLGVMLPYAPLHYLLLHPDDISLPVLVMTSANLSEEPIATENDEARERLSSLADAFLMHDRDIRTRCDDSVSRIFDKKIYPLRRSRGYSPDPLVFPFDVPEILAVGPELKNTFCLTRGRYAFVSHHIGDMENYETFRSFEDGINHFERLFRITPRIIAHDLHPDYLTTRYALERSGREDIKAIAVQHHHAHIAACMADNGLDGSRPVIGLSFDGTGFGKDGAIWGGEFLLADYKDFKRLYHLNYFTLPGGDVAIKRPARSALALLWSLGLDWEDWMAPVKDLCYEERQALHVQLDRNLNSPKTSSIGRLFDAVAALAGVRQRVNYEAQAAIEFESAIDPAETGSYRFEIEGGVVKVDECIRFLLKDVRGGVSIPIISARFHNGLADITSHICSEIQRQYSISEVAISGGVWQNLALLERSAKRLRKKKFRVYLHHQVPTNDGGISLGQAIICAASSNLL
jgi:hydrogenase maturation protein HypF